jgi:chromate transporter
MGALCALVFMFLPGFLLIAATLPFWQSIVNKPLATKAIAGINTVVVGILAAALINPIVMTSIVSAIDLFICLVAIVLLFKWHLSPLLVVIWCVVASLFVHFT